jgi:hypothetical protein
MKTDWTKPELKQAKVSEETAAFLLAGPDGGLFS